MTGERAHTHNDAGDVAGRVTGLLRRWRAGDDSAYDELLGALYDEMRQLAGAYMARERGHHTLQPTALVHEAFLRMTSADARTMANRSHFFAAAAQAMRRILVESARRHRADKRTPAVDPLQARFVFPEDVSFIDLDRALGELEAIEPRHARLVELRYFAGLTLEETSTVLGRSTSSLARDWNLARAWLKRRLDSLASSEGSR